jgi:PKD repeat protein
MKRSLSLSIIIALYAIMFQSCNKDLETFQSQVEFSFSADILKASNEQGLSSVVITIEDLQGNIVKNSEKIEIYNMNGYYISKPISLVTGEYKLSGFMVLNAANNIVYASPKEGSAKANLVNKPLPLVFTVQKDKVLKLSPEVLNTTECRPEDFGYSTFSFEIAGTFDFLIGAFVYNELSQNFELTPSNISIYCDTILVYSGKLNSNIDSTNMNYDSLGITNMISLPEKYNNFNIQITKDGYTAYDKIFTKEELRLHYRKEDKGPLVVILEKGCTLPINSANFVAVPEGQIWPHGKIDIENYSITDADSYVFDFGDGTKSTQAAFIPNTYHTYNHPGSYKIKLIVTKNGCVGISEKEISILTDDSCHTNAGIDIVVTVDHAFLSAQSVSLFSIGFWSVVGGNGTFINANDPTTEVTNLGLGVNTFRWEVYTGSCRSYDEVNVTNTAIYVNAGMDQSICTDSVNLNASNPYPGIGQWSLVSGSGIIMNVNNPTTRVTGLSLGTNVFRWKVTNSGYTDSDDVTINNNKVFANAGADAVISTSTFRLAAQPSRGTGTWSLISGSALIANPNSPTTLVSNLLVGSNTFGWTVTYNGCIAQDNLLVTRTSK